MKRAGQLAVFPYLGGKNHNCDRILAHLPASNVYVEPFMGSLGVYLNRRPRSILNFVSDLDGALVDFWRLLRDRTDALVRAVSLTPYAQAEYEQACREPVVDCEIETARRTYIRIFQGFLHSTKPSNFAGAGCAVGLRPSTTRARLEAVSEAIQGAILANEDGIHMLRKHGQRKKETLIYCDPPYMPETRTGADYSCELTSDDHGRFLDAALEATVMVAISGYDTPLYAERLSGWRCERWEQTLHAGETSLTGQQRRVTECLWMNYPADRVAPAQPTLWEGLETGGALEINP